MAFKGLRTCQNRDIMIKKCVQENTFFREHLLIICFMYFLHGKPAKNTKSVSEILDMVFVNIL